MAWYGWLAVGALIGLVVSRFKQHVDDTVLCPECGELMEWHVDHMHCAECGYYDRET
jgi:ribosomal protein S27AE